eukprot:2511427-Amphidinium_carterae.1
MNLHVGCTTKSTPVEIWLNSVASGAQARRAVNIYPVLRRAVHVGPQRSPSCTSSPTSWRVEATRYTRSKSGQQSADPAMLGSSSPSPTSLVARVLASEEGVGDPPDASFGRHVESAGADQQGEQEGDCGGAFQSATRTNDGQAVASISGENRDSTARFLWPQTRSTQAEGKCPRSLVDVPGLRIPVGEEDLHGATASCRREDAVWSSQGKPLRPDPGELQAMGHRRVRTGWRQYGTTIAAVLSLGFGGRGCGAVQTLPVSEGIHSASCTTWGARISDGRGRRDDSGVAHHRCLDVLQGVGGDSVRSLPRTMPGPSRKHQDELLRALCDTLAPRQARVHADAGARGFLLGLYTQQGGTGITKATWKYHKILEIVLSLTKQLVASYTLSSPLFKLMCSRK